MNVELCVGPGVLMAYCLCDLACSLRNPEAYMSHSKRTLACWTQINGVVNRKPCGSPWCTWERMLVTSGAVGTPLAAAVVDWSLQGHFPAGARAFNCTAECHFVLPPAANLEPIMLAGLVHFYTHCSEHWSEEAMQPTGNTSGAKPHHIRNHR